jgi:hypothetical protein
MLQKKVVQEECFRKADGSIAATSWIALAALLLVSTGCIHVRSSKFVIPARCVVVSIQSFTEPCAQRADGKIVCNGVVITANCIAPPLRNSK